MIPPSEQPFSNPDPFASADEGDSSGHPDGHASTSTHEDMMEKSPKKADDSDPSDGGSTHEGVVEKLTTKTDDAAHGVMDTVRSVRHKLHMDHVKATGPSRFLNPTNIHMMVRWGHGHEDSSDVQAAKEMSLMWRARDNRKGRNSIAVPATPTTNDPTFLPLRYTPNIKSSLKDIGMTFWRMFTTFPYWDMAFWSGWSYTIGSFLFILDGVFAWGPVAFGEEFLPVSVETYGGPLSFFIGALFYQVGAVAAYLEAVNDGSFHGSAMRRLLEGHEDDQKKLLDEKIHHFFSHLTPRHRDKEEAYTHIDPEAGWNAKDRLGTRNPTWIPRRGAVDMGGDEGDESTYMTWQWYPTWAALRSHHAFEIGFLACAIQLFGVTLYGVTAVVVLPWIFSTLSEWQTLAAFWVPQAVAAACFLIASTMFMLETQSKWWKPEPTVLGWWVGLWAVIGSVGFEMIACFGMVAHKYHWAEYQSDLATIWGSGAYFICSFIQWYEALSKNPVEELFHEPGELKSSQIHPI